MDIQVGDVVRLKKNDFIPVRRALIWFYFIEFGGFRLFSGGKMVDEVAFPSVQP